MIVPELRVGIVGCGALGVVHARRLSALPGVRVTAAADPIDAAVERVASTVGHGVLHARDHHEVIASEVDAVCIASPDGLHVRQALDALDAGLHVLCEKPLTLDPHGLADIIAAIDRSGRQMTMTYPRRHESRLRRLREEVLSGRAGRVLAASLYNTEEWVRSNAGTWRHDPAMCPGGFLYDANGHQVDTFFWLTGTRASWVEARTANHGTPSPMAAWGTGELADGGALTFHFVGVGPTWIEKIHIQCEHAYFTIDNGQPYQWCDGALRPIVSDEPAEHADDVFVRLIREGGTNWAPPSDLWPVVNFTRCALASAERGCRVEVPPAAD